MKNTPTPIFTRGSVVESSENVRLRISFAFQNLGKRKWPKSLHSLQGGACSLLPNKDIYGPILWPHFQGG